jgi:hypothetical protein
MVDLGDKAGATKLIIDSLGDSQKNFKDASKSDLDDLRITGRVSLKR